MLLPFVMICVAGALFGLAAMVVVRQFGRYPLVLLWLTTSVVVGGLFTMRSLAVQSTLARGPQLIVPGWYALMVATMAVILSVPALKVARRVAQGGTMSLRRTTLLSAWWTFLGLVIALLIVLVLDVTGVPFLPIRGGLRA